QDDPRNGIGRGGEHSFSAAEVSGEGCHDEVELRDDRHRLAAGAACGEGVYRPILVWIVFAPPEISVIDVAQVVERRAGARGELLANDPVALPASAVKHHLAEFDEVAQ